MQKIILGIVIKREPVKEKDIRATILTACGLKKLNITGVQKAQLFSVSEFTVVGHKIIKEYVMESNHGITKIYKNYLRAGEICINLLQSVPFANEYEDFPIAIDEFKDTIAQFEKLSKE